MKPTPSQVHVNTPLTNLSIAYMQSAENFIADKVFPVIPVTKKSDLYYLYDRGYFNKSQMKKRAPGTESQGADYAITTDSYLAEVYALHKDIDDETRANADSVLNQDGEATSFLTHQGLISRELNWVTAFFSTSIWGSDITGVSGTPSTNEVKQWNDAAAEPIENVRLGKTTVLESTGFEPNTLVIGKRVYDALLDHPDVLDRVKYGQTAGAPAMVNANVLAQLFEVDRVLVMKSIQNTANEAQTASHSFIGGKKALLCYVPPSPGIMTPAAGYTFAWNQYEQAAFGISTSRFRMEHLKADRIEMNMAYVQKKIASAMGYFWTSIVA